MSTKEIRFEHNYRQKLTLTDQFFLINPVFSFWDLSTPETRPVKTGKQFFSKYLSSIFTDWGLISTHKLHYYFFCFIQWFYTRNVGKQHIFGDFRREIVEVSVLRMIGSDRILGFQNGRAHCPEQAPKKLWQIRFYQCSLQL